MKVLLYFKGMNLLPKQYTDQVLKCQSEALRSAGVEFTTDVNDDFDILHINTFYPVNNSIIKKANKINFFCKKYT